MGVIISFFKWIVNGLSEVLGFLLSWPGLIVAAIQGVVASFSTFYTLLNTTLLPLPRMLSFVRPAIASYVALIDSTVNGTIFHFLGYCTAFDVFWGWLTSLFGVITPFLIFLITTFCLTIPVFLIEIYLIKLAIWFVCLFIPQGFLPASVESLSQMDTKSLDSQTPDLLIE